MDLSVGFLGSSSCESRFFLWPKRTGPKTSTLSAIFKGLCCVFVLGCFMWRQFAGGCPPTHGPSLWVLHQPIWKIPPNGRSLQKLWVAHNIGIGHWQISSTMTMVSLSVSSSCHLRVPMVPQFSIPLMKVLLGWTLNPYGSFIKVLSKI